MLCDGAVFLLYSLNILWLVKYVGPNIKASTSRGKSSQKLKMQFFIGIFAVAMILSTVACMADHQRVMSIATVI